MGPINDIETAPRRTVLKAAGGGLGFGSGRASETAQAVASAGCPDTSIEPGMVHFDDSITETCADDQPATEELQQAVKDSLQTTYPTVGSLIDERYVPYFDLLTADGESGWSHWLNPAFIDDDTVVDPERPESVLVDHKWWWPIGVMFIATRDGRPVDPPPAAYTDDRGACTTWHAHTGLPGRYSWWKYPPLRPWGGRILPNAAVPNPLDDARLGVPTSRKRLRTRRTAARESWWPAS